MLGRDAELKLPERLDKFEAEQGHCPVEVEDSRVPGNKGLGGKDKAIGCAKAELRTEMA